MSHMELEKLRERSYEEAMTRLEEIVQRLENGNLTLEEGLSLFEEGIGLARYCTGKLDAADSKLEILLGFDGVEPRIAEFTLEPEGDT